MRQCPYLIVVFAALHAPFSIAAADEPLSGWYLAGSIGAVSSDDAELVSGGIAYDLEFDSGAAAGLSVGYKPNWSKSVDYRAEIELWGFQQDIDKYNGTAITVDSGSSVNTIAVMGNGFIDFKNTSSVSPYIGVGLGLASVEVDALNASQKDDYVWSYQLLAGLAYEPEIFQQLSFTFGYRLFGMEDAKYFFGSLENHHVNSVQFGMRYLF